MNLDKGRANPPYPFQHSGAVLVCGSAWTLLDDYTRARQFLPDVPCIAVKDASAYVKAFALFGLHYGKLERMRLQQSAIHTEFTVHTSFCQTDYTKFGKKRTGQYDYLWHGISGVNSGWGGVRLAQCMGFEKIILCGIPLERGGYIGGKFSKVFQDDRVIDIYRQQVERDSGFHHNVFSMSGWTREFFGDCLPNQKP